MAQRRNRRRVSQRTSARHSATMARGRGDPRDRRREQSRLTDRGLDEDVLEIDSEGRITLKLSNTLGRRIGELLEGAGLQRGSDGSLSVKLSARNMGMDQSGRLGVNIAEKVTRLSAFPGTPAVNRQLGGTTAADLSTLAAAFNELVEALSLNVKVAAE